MASPAETARRLTVADYMALDDDRRHELVDGVLVMAPARTFAHQDVLGSLYSALNDHVQRHGLGRVGLAPADLVLDETTVVQPDLLFVSEARWTSLFDGHGITGAPDLVVEVLSPSNASHDRTTKRDLYLRAGVPWLVLVDPAARVVEIFRLGGDTGPRYRLEANLAHGDVLTLESLLPGFSLPLASIWFAA